MSAMLTPARQAVAVTPSDSTSIAGGVRTKGLYIGGAGNVAVVFENAAAVVFTAVPAGTILPISCIRVNSTNTTATNIVALF